MLMFGLRLGPDPRVVVTTTPKPIKIIRELIADPTTAITRGSTYDNRANLAPAFLEQIIRKYEGTRLGRQELNAEILDDVPGALWNRARIEDTRWPAHRNVPELIRIVIAIDPAVSSGDEADETGIIVAGIDANEVYIAMGRARVHLLRRLRHVYRARLRARDVRRLSHNLFACFAGRAR